MPQKIKSPLYIRQTRKQKEFWSLDNNPLITFHFLQSLLQLLPSLLMLRPIILQTPKISAPAPKGKTTAFA